MLMKEAAGTAAPPTKGERAKVSLGSSRRPVILAVVLAVLLLATVPATASTTTQTEDVLGQGEVGIYAPDGAELTRKNNGLAIQVTMPVPQPNTYTYPAGIPTPSASPEVFTGWVFVFNNPEGCAGGPGNCGGADVTPANPGGLGIYNFAGHATGAGGNLVLTGQIAVGQPAGGPPFLPAVDLYNVQGAEVHVAIAPHGKLDAAQLPGQMQTPAGNPACACWWLALFDPPA
jgi:hypothetical protein